MSALWTISSDSKYLVTYSRSGIPILINCLKGSSKKEDERDHLECIKILVSQQLPLDATDSSGKTVIHWAVLLDKIEICHFLLKKGAPANNLDHGKMSPIHIAISKRSEEFVEMLCEFGPVEVRSFLGSVVFIFHFRDVTRTLSDIYETF